MNHDLDKLAERQRVFAAERDWDQYHSPKNLSMALTVEAAELLEHFQWLTEQQSRDLPDEKKIAIEEEVADILLYLVRLSDQLGINIFDAAMRKIDANAAKYPAEQVRGSARKYTEYPREENPSS